MLAMPKFWLLFLSLAGVKCLENGMSELTDYLENIAENRQVLASFLPKGSIEEVDVKLGHDKLSEH